MKQTELKSTFQSLTKRLGRTLLNAGNYPFNITYSIEINCNTLPEPALSKKIFEHRKFKDFFLELQKIEKPIVYWFEISSKHTAESVRLLMSKYRSKKKRKNFPAMKKTFNPQSKTIYVGKMKRDIKGRMFVHLGYYIVPGTQGLQLSHWAKGTGLKVRLNIVQLPFDDETANLGAHYELELAKMLTPLAGKHR